LHTQRFINVFSIPLKSEPRGDTLNIKEKILALKEEEGIAILAHNYQPAGVQDVADYLGDSLDLCYRAQELEEDTILFAGVRFMAESALILNPEKTVLVPNKDAFCPMAAMLSPADIIAKKQEYPDAPVVLYGNTNAASKAHADVICTSANALRIVESLNEETVLFGPDKNLRHWVSTQTDTQLVPVPEDGYCYVHNSRISVADIAALKGEHPDAEVLVHPECTPEVQELADHILSTNGMLSIARKSSAREFIIGTEKELCYRLRKELPEKLFYELPGAVCDDMKKVTLESVYEAMRSRSSRMELPADIMDKARVPLERMLELSRN
jgi:quinolinate synthase